MNPDGSMNIELFPCAGGMAEGFRRAGVSFDMAIEIEENHCDSYEENIGHRPLQMDARAFLWMLQDGWRPPRPVRLLCADPPCTPWSRAGKRMGTDDPRDMLEGTCRIIALLKPTAYLIGNVPGLDDGPNLHIVQRVIGGLAKHGYCTADFARLDAANYGVPQHRIRPWWFGHLHGPCIQWPEPTHCDPEEWHPAFAIDGIRELAPWVTCRQALGHLTLEELGRPIRLRKRNQHSPQHGSVLEKPARVVGTSNLSDGNVMLLPGVSIETPKKKGRKRDEGRVAQGNRVGDLDKPSATMTAKPSRKGAGQAHTFTLQPARGSIDGLNALDAPAHAIVQNTHGNGSILVNIVNDRHPPAELDRPAPTVGAKQRGQSGVIQMEPHHPASRQDEPAMTVRAGSGGGANRCLEWRTESDSQGGRPADADKPAPTVTAAQRGGHIITVNEKHRPVHVDEPIGTLRGGGSGHSAPPFVITSSQHPASKEDSPSNTIRATTGAGSNRALEWPWDRPGTTIQGDNRLAPPGHHPDDGSWMSQAQGVVISEKAAAILQGFPDDWKFVGKTKKERWSQIGQAMPPPLAHAVAGSVVAQMKRADTLVLRTWSDPSGDGSDTLDFPVRPEFAL